MTPYIVMHRDRYPSQSDSSAPFGRLHSRRAVASLEEAQGAAREIVGNLGSFEAVMEAPATQVDALDTITELPESGGKIGPLPDGSQIEVTPTDYGELAIEADDPALHQNWEILAAYNEARKV